MEMPEAGTGPSNVKEPVAVVPPVTATGLIGTASNSGGRTTMNADALLPPSQVAATPTVSLPVTAAVVTGKVRTRCPGASVTAVGTLATRGVDVVSAISSGAE